jgi:tRNA dimethylallyltransferase
MSQQSTQRYFSLVGPTAVGKTELAFWLARQLLHQQLASGIDIISADSRQVYQGLEVLSGADLPPHFTFNSHDNFFLQHFANKHEDIRLYGVSIIKPTEEWSVAHFQQLVKTVVAREELGEGRVAIIVGGTGLYHQHITNPDTLLHIPPNAQLRNQLQELSVYELQSLLKELRPAKLADMNNSDRANPRRLIRAIEIEKGRAQATENSGEVDAEKALPPALLTLGITDAGLRIKKRIEQRVRDRFSNGAQQEVAHLMAVYEDWTLPAFSTTGVREVRAYLEDRITADECLQHWTLSEIQYAKRQQTWWKKRAVDDWISIQHSNWKELAAAQVLPLFQIES